MEPNQELGTINKLYFEYFLIKFSFSESMIYLVYGALTW